MEQEQRFINGTAIQQTTQQLEQLFQAQQPVVTRLHQQLLEQLTITQSLPLQEADAQA
jgi:hypothetical protein